MLISQQVVGGEIVNRDRDHKSTGLPPIRLFRLEDVVRQYRFLNIPACAKQRAGRRERLGDLGDDSRGAENRELRAERGEQMAAMSLATMIGMDGDLVDERAGRSLGADQNADRVGA